MLYGAMVVGTVVMMIVSAFYYVWLTWHGVTKPVLATWILMLVVISLSFIMYWSNPNKSWTANIAVVAGVFNISTILIGVLVTNIRNHTLNVAFDTVQKWCLFSGAVIVVFWMITKDALISYGLVQSIALIAYFATVKKLLKAKECTESLVVWGAVLLATLCAVYPAWVNNDIFSWIYLGRAVPSTSGLMFLIWRVKKRSTRD